MGLPAAKRALVREVNRVAPLLFRVSRELYRQPELGFKEHLSSALLANILEGAGFRVERGLAGMPTAFRAQFGAGEPRVAILAEYDALPELGHACGHNLIAAASLGAALALAALPERPAGTVVVLGTPAEEGAAEGAGGKAALLEAGAFAGLAAALMVHPGDQDAVDVRTAAREALEARCYGVGALDALLWFFAALEGLGPPEEEVLVHGVIREGGRSPWCDPREAVARLYVRAATSEELERAVRRTGERLAAAARSLSCRAELTPYARTYREFRPNATLARLYRDNLRLLGREAACGGQAYGATDMGNVSQALPAMHGYINVADRPLSAHTREFARACLSGRGRRALLDAAKGLGMTVLDCLREEGTLAAAWQDFRAGG